MIQSALRWAFCVLAGLVLAGEAAEVRPVVPDRVRPLPLGAVRLKGGVLGRALELDARYLLALEPDRMLAGYRLRAGLEPRARGYGGWDSVEGKQLTGHLAGHYLSGASLMYAATGDGRFKEWVDFMVRELAEVQRARGSGYLGAITDAAGVDGEVILGQVARGDIRSGGFDLNGMWSPWYTLHKVFAGLRDAYRHAGNVPALALALGFAGWEERVFGGMGAGDVQRMLNTEFGGMNEVLVDLYADTGEGRWLELADLFAHRAVEVPLRRHEDRLGGLHGNTQVPKVIGMLDRFVWGGEVGDGLGAGYFWDRVVRYHSYATGGHGKDEYFGEPGKLSDRVDGRTAETCNVYNMLKLTRRLFALDPSARYADFQERALFNHILASQHPEEGWVCYMVPVGRGVQREYERDLLAGGFTCCTASSLESHALHGDGLYYESGDTLWISQYAASEVEWSGVGVRLEVRTDFPMDEEVEVRLAMEGERELALVLRRPHWVGEGFGVQVNGEETRVDEWVPGGEGGESSFVRVRRTWSDGDRLRLRLPKRLRLEALPDNPQRVAILWGPLVLAGDLGGEEVQPWGAAGAAGLETVPVFVAAGRPVEDWLRPVEEKPGWFRTQGVGRDREVEFAPLYQLHERTYGVYWDLFTEGEWSVREVEIAAEREARRRLEEATVGYVQPGEMQAERDAGMQGEGTRPDRVMGRAGRRGDGWFSFELPVEPRHAMVLVVTYNRDEWRERTFDVLVDGVVVGRQRIERRGALEFFEVEYPVPSEVVVGKEKVRVSFEATGGNETGCVFGVRMVRAER